MRLTKRPFAALLALPVAVLALVAGLLVVGPASPASAAGPTISFSPSGPFGGGESVTVSVTGFSPGAPVAVMQCPTGRTLNGPGDCGRSAEQASKLISVDEAGAGSATVLVKTGPLNNSTAPAAVCDPAHPCDFAAVNIAEADEQVRIAIPYADEVRYLSLSPVGPYRDGQKVSIVATGFTPSAPVAIAQCRPGGPALGPGDCGRSVAGGLRLTTADDHGVARTTLTLAYGPLNNQTPPALVCTEEFACPVQALNIANMSEFVSSTAEFSGELVKPKVTIKLSKAKVEAGKKVTFTGKVSPNAMRETVQLQRKQKNGWVTKKSTKLSDGSAYSISWKPMSTKDYRWRVKIGKTAYHPSSTSATRLLRVT